MSNILPVVGEKNGSRLYRIGVIGFDQGDDDGGVYTSTLRSDPISPVGEGGLALFRRVSVRILRSGTCTFKVRAYVDGAQTQIYDASSALIDQEVTFTGAATALKEELFEMSIAADGTYIEVEIEIDSDDINSVFLVESIFVHAHLMRQALQRAATSN